MIPETLNATYGDAFRSSSGPSPWQSAYHEYNDDSVAYRDDTCQPIVIPQRRPGSKDRGFTIAYPPSLGSYGIDQNIFLEFIQGCNTALQGHAALMAVGVAGFGVGLAPEPITMLVGAAVQFGASALNKNVAKWRTNSFLEKQNNELFSPRGLRCYIGVHDPETDAGLAMGREVVSISSNLSANPYRQSNSLQRVEDVAPLQYLADAKTSPPTDAEVPTKKSSAGRRAKQAFAKLQNYLDQKAQTTYATENPGDILTALQAPTERTSRTRPLLPSYDFARGGQSYGRVSGSKFGQMGNRNHSHREDGARQDSTESERKIKKDVLYLIIVPTRGPTMGSY